MKRIGIYLSLLFIISFFSLLAYAETNGIWSRAEDIRGGIFGNDELDDTSYFTFLHPVNISSRLTVETLTISSLDSECIIQADNGLIRCSELRVPQLCSGSGKALQWNGSEWACLPVISISGSSVCDALNEGNLRYNPDLKNIQFCNGSSWNIPGDSDSQTESGDSVYSGDLIDGIHSTDDCRLAGGTVYETLDGHICRFSLSACPSGWSQYLSWSSTYPSSCSGGSCGYGCGTSSHAFSNLNVERCTYYPANYVEGVRDAESQNCVESGTKTCSASRIEIGCI